MRCQAAFKYKKQATKNVHVTSWLLRPRAARPRVPRLIMKQGERVTGKRKTDITYVGYQSAVQQCDVRRWITVKQKI